MRLSDLDLGDADRGRRLAVAAMAAVVLPTLELHDQDLPSASLADDLAGDPGALERLGVRDDVAVAGHEQPAPGPRAPAPPAGAAVDPEAPPPTPGGTA